MSRGRSVILTISALVLLTQSHSTAWSGPGHAAVAAMAYLELSETLRTHLTGLLEKHLRFKTWKQEFDATKASLPAGLDLGMFLFIRASTWPDEIRDTQNVKLVPFDHPNWHFVNYPLRPPTFETGPGPNPKDDVLFGIRRSAETLASAGASSVEHAAALSWLIHLVADVHQPLHCTALITATFKPPTGDQGGNLFRIFQTPEQKTQKLSTKLHGFWDSRLGADLRPAPAKGLQDARTLATTHPRATLDELSAGNNVEQWSFESRDAAVAHAYQFKGLALKPRDVLPSGYITNSHRVARRRLALAGYRLADMLVKLPF